MFVQKITVFVRKVNAARIYFFRLLGICVKVEFGIFSDKCSSNTATKELKGFCNELLKPISPIISVFSLAISKPRFPLYELLKFRRNNLEV